MKQSSPRSPESGAVIPALLVIVVVCGALAMSALLPALGQHGEARALVERERAFQLAEAGIDWGIAEIRKSNGVVPTTATETRAPGNGSSGQFTLTYVAGNNNARDDDGDGVVDDSDEADLVQLTSTGTSNDYSRTLRVMLRKSVTTPNIESAIQFNVENPILDVNGNSFFVSGFEHLLDGSEDLTRPAHVAIAAPTAEVNLASQIAANRADQIVGLGGEPSVGTVDAIDLDTLVEQAKAATTHALIPGTYSDLSLGTPTPGGVVVAVSEGDLHLSGTVEGYGVLVVDGDLHASGQLLWTGIVIVRGRCDMTGGGSGKRLIGSMIVGEEVIGGDDSQTVKLTGTIDMHFSSDAILLAQQRLAIMTVLSWEETANP
jgi:Tfp pilus assembly protein PilX